MSELSIAIDKFKNGYPCSSCGCCCNKIDVAVSNIESFALQYNIPFEELKFPYNWDESGKCEMLDDDNRCKVYHNRPNICNIEWITNRIDINKEKFYNLNIETCNRLMDEDGIDKSFRIKI